MSFIEHENQILEFARDQNILVAGPDGVGKRYIGICLLREIQDKCIHKKTFWIVPNYIECKLSSLMIQSFSFYKIYSCNDTNTLENICNDTIKLTTCIHDNDVFVSPPQVLSTLLYKKVISLSDINLIVFQMPLLINKQMPNFLNDLLQCFPPIYEFNNNNNDFPKLYAFEKLPYSNNIPPIFQTRFHSFPLILAESLSKQNRLAPIILQKIKDNKVRKEPINSFSNKMGDTDLTLIEALESPQDFLCGENDAQIDFCEVLACELEMGNSTSSTSEKAKRKKINKFVSDGDIIYHQLGGWCFLKYLELEIKSKIRACSIEIDDSKYYHNDILENQKSDAKCLYAEEKAKHLASIEEIIKWIRAARKDLGLNASERLKKTAEIIESRYRLNGSEKIFKTWITVERKIFTRPIAEFLTERFPERLPCGGLAGQTAVTASADHFSSIKKVLNLFETGKIGSLVTTLVETEMKAPSFCDLAIIFDETNEPNKLLFVNKNVDKEHGAVIYLMSESEDNDKNFSSLRQKVKLLREMEMEQSQDRRKDDSYKKVETAKEEVIKNKNNKVIESSYRYVMEGSGEILTLENSEMILNSFCEALPGHATYELRPQYKVDRFFVNRSEKCSNKYDVINRKTKQLKEEEINENQEVALKEENNGHHQDLDKISDNSTSLYLYSVKLRLPVVLNIPLIKTPQVINVDFAKTIASYKAVLELIKKKYVDDRFKSCIHNFPKLYRRIQQQYEISDDYKNTSNICDEDKSGKKAETANNTKEVPLIDLSTQSTYDIKPVTAYELGLPTIRSVFDQASSSGSQITLYLYSLHYSPVNTDDHQKLRFLSYGILSAKELLPETGGKINSDWRYNFATTGALTNEIVPVTLQLPAKKIELSHEEVVGLLQYHVKLVRLICMSIDAADKDFRATDDGIWKAFDKKNDKGYMVVPLEKSKKDVISEINMYGDLNDLVQIDWSHVHDTNRSSLLKPAYPLPTHIPIGETLFVPLYRRNVFYYTEKISELSADDIQRIYVDSENSPWKDKKSAHAVAGEPILGRWYNRDEVIKADRSQPIIHVHQGPLVVPLIRRVFQRNNKVSSKSIRKKENKERFLYPQYSYYLHFTKKQLFDGYAIIPILFDFERVCQLFHLMNNVLKMEIDINLLNEATRKPEYERLETLGDTFLKLEASWYLYQVRQDVRKESALTLLRTDVIRNDRLAQWAVEKGIHNYISFQSRIEQSPFLRWKPSCVGLPPDALSAPAKWIADVIEAICGAYLVGKGEKVARSFLHFIGVPTVMSSTSPNESLDYKYSYYPDCYPNDIEYDDHFDSDKKKLQGLKISLDENLPMRMFDLQKRMNYFFSDQRLLLEAITCPSMSDMHIQISDDGENIQEFKGDYERLEYLGDALIEYICLSYGFLHCDAWGPDDLTKWKSSTVCNDTLGKVSIQVFELDNCVCDAYSQSDEIYIKKIKYLKDIIHINNNSIKYIDEEIDIFENKINLPKKFADIFESLVAAVFIDSGYNLQKIRDVFLTPILKLYGEKTIEMINEKYCDDEMILYDKKNKNNSNENNNDDYKMED